jgi:hypothetical protein
VLRRPLEPKLAAVVSVVDQTRRRSTLTDRHVERVQDQLGAQVLSHGPAHNSQGEGVQDHREIQPALAGALLGDIGDPEPVGAGRLEVTLDEIRRR